MVKLKTFSRELLISASLILEVQKIYFHQFSMDCLYSSQLTLLQKTPREMYGRAKNTPSY